MTEPGGIKALLTNSRVTEDGLRRYAFLNSCAWLQCLNFQLLIDYTVSSCSSFSEGSYFHLPHSCSSAKILIPHTLGPYFIKENSTSCNSQPSFEESLNYGKFRRTSTLNTYDLTNDSALYCNYCRKTDCPSADFLCPIFGRLVDIEQSRVIDQHGFIVLIDLCRYFWENAYCYSSNTSTNNNAEKKTSVKIFHQLKKLLKYLLRCLDFERCRNDNSSNYFSSNQRTKNINNIDNNFYICGNSCRDVSTSSSDSRYSYSSYCSCKSDSNNGIKDISIKHRNCNKNFRSNFISSDDSNDDNYKGNKNEKWFIVGVYWRNNYSEAGNLKDVLHILEEFEEIWESFITKKQNKLFPLEHTKMQTSLFIFGVTTINYQNIQRKRQEFADEKGFKSVNPLINVDFDSVISWFNIKQKLTCSREYIIVNFNESISNIPLPNDIMDPICNSTNVDFCFPEMIKDSLILCEIYFALYFPFYLIGIELPVQFSSIKFVPRLLISFTGVNSTDTRSNKFTDISSKAKQINIWDIKKYIVEGFEESKNAKNIKIFSISITRIFNPYLGEAEKYMRTIFSEALDNSPSILVIDSLEAIGLASQYCDLPDYRRRLLVTLLLCIDELNTRQMYAQELMCGSNTVTHNMDTVRVQVQLNGNPVEGKLQNVSSNIQKNFNRMGKDYSIKGFVGLVGLSNSPPEMLDKSLTRAGRFDKWFSI